MASVAPYWYVRRLKVSEVDFLRSIQTVAPHYYNRYPHHAEWVKKCIKLIKQGERDAFAVFVAQPPEEQQTDQPRYKHAGSVILKRTFGDSVELKNFLLNEKCFHECDLDQVRSDVLEKAYMYCERRGFGRLAIELSPGDAFMPSAKDVPQATKEQERHLITFLHEQGFRVASLVASRYQDGDFFYLLEKELVPRYYGDPFDFLEMIQWILRYRFPAFKVGAREDTLRSRQLGAYPDAVNVFTQTVRLPFPDPSVSEEILHKATIRLQSVIYPDKTPIPLPADLYSDEPSVRVLFANTPSNQKQAFGVGDDVVVFSQEEIYDILGGKSCDASLIYFDKEEIGGLVVSVAPEHFIGLKSLDSKDKKLAFFLWWGGFGRFADYEGDGGSSNFLVFHFPIPPVDVQSGAHDGFFIAELEQCRKEKAEILWEEYRDVPKLIDKHDYLQFTRHIDPQADTEVIGLVCRNLTYIEEGISFLDLVERVDGAEARKFYGDRVTASGVMTTYISSNVAAELNEILQVKQSEAGGTMSESRDVFVCHAGEDKEEVVRPLVEALKSSNISYWFDEAEIAWGDSVVAKVEEGLRLSQYVIAVISARSLKKAFPEKELRSALSVEAGTGEVKVLPLLVGTEAERNDIRNHLLFQHDKAYMVWEGNPAPVIEALKKRLGK